MTNVLPEVSDDQLLAIELRTDDPASIDRVSPHKPVLDGPPTILLEYHLATSRQPVRCCYCETKTPHWNGFVVEGATGSRHLIGSSCGPKHLGLSFGQARRAFGVQVARQSLLRRIASLRPKMGAMLSYRPPIDRLQKLKLAEEAFKSGAPELYRDLRRIAVAGEVLFETTMVRDFEAETRADSKEPKFKPELKPMGPLRGSAFVRARTLSDSLDARQKAFASFIRMIAQGTDDLSERQLRVAIGSLEESDTRAREAIALLNKAHEFFQQRNLDRIRRSNLKSSRELPEIAEQKFGFCNRRADVSWHPVPVPTAISLPPTLDAV